VAQHPHCPSPDPALDPGPPAYASNFHGHAKLLDTFVPGWSTLDDHSSRAPSSDRGLRPAPTASTAVSHVSDAPPAPSSRGCARGNPRLALTGVRAAAPRTASSIRLAPTAATPPAQNFARARRRDPACDRCKGDNISAGPRSCLAPPAVCTPRRIAAPTHRQPEKTGPGRAMRYVDHLPFAGLVARAQRPRIPNARHQPPPPSAAICRGRLHRRPVFLAECAEQPDHTR